MVTPERAAGVQDEVELVGVLDEFRTALREELDAARRVAAGAGIQLLNGQLIAQAAESYQYAFTLESVLSLFATTPGGLRLLGGRLGRLVGARQRLGAFVGVRGRVRLVDPA